MPHDPAAPVWTAWDLGIRDATAIWFAQAIGREVRLIDYYEASGVDLGHDVREIVARPYAYAGHVVPHDAQARELGTGKSRLEVLASLGLNNITLAPMHRIEDGINGVQRVHPEMLLRSREMRARRGRAQTIPVGVRRDAARAAPRPAARWTCTRPTLSATWR